MNQGIVQHQQLRFSDELEQRTEKFQGALPPHIPVAKFKSVLLTAVNNQPELINADRRSFFNSAQQAANDGLMPDGREAALVIYNNKVEVEQIDEKGVKRKVDRWVKFVQYIPMVAGIMKKVRNSGEIANWQIYAVHEKDTYEIIEGFDANFLFRRYLEGDPGKLLFCASLVTFKTGERSLEIMTTWEIEKVRARSKAKSEKSPWQTDYEEMCKKTVIKRHSKRLPMNTDLMDLMRKDDALYDYEGQSDKAIGTQARRPTLADFSDSVTGKLMDSNPKADAGKSADNENAGEPAHDPETGEIPTPEFSAADAMELGREHRRQNRPRRPPAEWTNDGWTEAYVEGFNAEDAEIAQAQKGKA